MLENKDERKSFDLRLDTVSSSDDVPVGDEGSSTELAEVAAGVGVGPDKGRQPRPLVRVGGPASHNLGLEFPVVCAAL